MYYILHLAKSHRLIAKSSELSSVPLEGIEPPSLVPKTNTLSIKLQGHIDLFYYTIQIYSCEIKQVVAYATTCQMCGLDFYSAWAALIAPWMMS